MNIRTLPTIAGLLLASLAFNTASAQTIILQDNFNVSSNGTGFAYGSGLNAGITTNPPATRLTGTVAGTLRYFASDTSKTNTAYSITNDFVSTPNTSKMRVAAAANSGRVSFTETGSSLFNFGPALGSVAATKATPAQYDIEIKMAVSSATTQRASFALTTADGGTTAWDFGFQLHRGSGENFYTITHRVNSASSGAAISTNAPIALLAPNSYGTEISMLMRVLDAGAESGTNFNSRMQLSLDGGASWFYDTQSDTTISNQWRFDAATRFLLWDIAGSGALTCDDLTVTSVFAPSLPNKTWTGAGSDNNWSTGANWGGTAPVNGDGLVFAGTTRQSNVNDLTALSVPFLSFNNGGFTISGNPLAIDVAVTNVAGTSVITSDLSAGIAGIKTWALASGSELVLSNTVTADVNGDHLLSGGGVLRQFGAMNFGLVSAAVPAFVVHEGQHIIDGGSYTTDGGYRIGSIVTGSGAKTILTNNAKLTLAMPGGNVRVGDSANPITAELRVYNSLLSLAGGNLGVGYATGSTGLVMQVGGTNMGGHVVFSDAGDAKGTYTIKDGTLETFQIKEDVATGSSTLQFDNAVLRTSPGASNAFMAGLNTVTIQAGGLQFDVLTNITVAQNNIGGSGNLTKTGPAALTMSGNLNYTGNTLVQNGALILTTGRTNTAVIEVANSAEFGVRVNGADASRSISSLSLGTGASTTLSFDLSTNGTPTAPILKVGSLSANGTVTVNITNESAWTLGDIVLVDYDGSVSGAFNLVLGTPITGLPAGASATLVNNTANGSIDLRISDSSVLTFNSVSRDGNNVVMSGTGGLEGASYTVLTSANVTLPLASWTPVATNVFGAGGSFSHTTSTSANTAFFVVKRP